MAGAKEISQYLKRFSQLDAARFAVVKVGGAVLRDDLDALTSSLAFLQDVGLTPIVIHGAGPQLDETLSAAGIEKHTVNGPVSYTHLDVYKRQVDFWTEASLFSQAGLTALVYGPGDIAQAHTADEFVTLEQLQRYAVTVTRILGNQTT